MSIKVDKLSYTYQPDTPFEKEALYDLTFEIPDGQITAIMGHTGSGKSTLAQHFNGLLLPTDGSCTVNGLLVNSKNLKEVRQHVGMIFQYPEYQLFDETVLKDIAYGILLRGVDPVEAEKRAADAMRLVGLDPETLGNRSPFDLSGGQKRRAAIAGVLVMEPEILVMDEPAAGLDPEGRREILNLVRTLNKERGITVVIVSHSAEDMAELADNILVLRQGRLHAYGTPREVFSDSSNLEEAGLELPLAKQLLINLSQFLPGLDTGAYTVEGATEAIIQYSRGEAHE
ncbi:MAG: energy-coupling factor transporter ATPase [Clostridia bacterium]|nr:energy-coupling factor transporter ATPase [Clostridia bacterium]